MPRSRSLRSLIATVPVALAGGAAAQPIMLSFDEPDLDRWNYPFNFTPGSRVEASTFAALEEPDFDDRDGQMLIGFDTIGLIPTDEGQSRYQVRSVIVRVATTTGGFLYDATYDPFTTYLPGGDPMAEPDADAGRPVELHGVNYRNGFTDETYLENSPWAPATNPDNPTYFMTRNAFPSDFEGGVGDDISNNVRQGFDPTPWAVGQLTNRSPGDLVQADDDFAFELDLRNPDVVAYLRRSLNDGRIRLMVSSLHPAVKQGGVFAPFFTKENAFGFGFAARLEIDVCVGAPADLNCDGIVDSTDLALLLGSWGSDSVAADIDGDGSVGSGDLALLLGSWGTG